MDLHYSQTEEFHRLEQEKFESPMDLHYSQTASNIKSTALSFESPMDLHYSQTILLDRMDIHLFESPMDLHYSQTYFCNYSVKYKFESPMDLHYSQTDAVDRKLCSSLNPLWIYTTLKHANSVYYFGGCLNPLWIYTTLKPQIRENVLHTSHIIHKRYRFCRIIIFHTNLHQLSIAFHFLKLDIPYFPEK